MITPEQKQALDEYAVEVTKFKVACYDKLEAVISEAIAHGDPMILTRVLRKALGV